MKRLFATTLLLFMVVLGIPGVSYARGGSVHVNGYFRSNGTYVQPHYRSAPDGNPYNNYSFPGNTNPYTGKVAPGNPDTYLRNYYSPSPSYSAPSLPNTSYTPPDYSGLLSPFPSYPSNPYTYPSYSPPTCAAGYFMNNGQCVNYMGLCKAKYGEHSTGEKKDETTASCYCLPGYTWSAEQTACVDTASIPPPAYTPPITQDNPQRTADLQAQIAALLAQIQQLQRQLNQR